MQTELVALQTDNKEQFYQVLGKGIRDRIDYLQNQLETEPNHLNNSVEVDNLFQTLELLGLQSWIIPF